MIKEATPSTMPKVSLGALLGALFSLPLIAVLLLGERIAGLPFPPFDAFDALARILPGDVLTFGIDLMVDVLIALGLGANLDTTAKMAEQGMALMLFLLMGALVGAILFSIARQRGKLPLITALIIGASVGFLNFAMSAPTSINATAPVFVSLSAIVMAFIGWAWVMVWAHTELCNIISDEHKSMTFTTENSANVMNRRQFLVRVGGASAVFTVIGAGLSAMFNTSMSSFTRREGTTTPADPTAFVDGNGNLLPNWDDPVMPASGTRAEYTPLNEHYRIDIVVGSVPELDETTYKLPITGLIANEVNWTLEEIRAMPSVSEFITMSCISNRIGGTLIGTTKWTGVPMQYILEQIQPDADAVALKITGADNFDEYLSLDLIRQDERILLAYAFDDQPLPFRNGFPLRVHIPDRYGMKQPKWITNIEVVDANGEGYWVRRGWSRDAFVRATSVIDTVATDAIYTDDAGVLRVPIGGIAWAGARGISKVEVSINDDDWQEAELRSPMSDRTWAIWRYDWAFTEGAHNFAVRCYEADGTMQTLINAEVRPDGATGIHRVGATLSNPADA